MKQKHNRQSQKRMPRALIASDKEVSLVIDLGDFGNALGHFADAVEGLTEVQPERSLQVDLQAWFITHDQDGRK